MEVKSTKLVQPFIEIEKEVCDHDGCTSTIVWPCSVERQYDVAGLMTVSVEAVPGSGQMVELPGLRSVRVKDLALFAPSLRGGVYSPNGTLDEVRHKHYYGYEAELDHLREWRARLPETHHLLWEAVMFAFFTEQAIMLREWGLHNWTFSPTPKKYNDKEIVRWLRKEIRDIGLRKRFDDGLEIPVEFLDNACKAGRWYRRCERKHITFKCDEVLVRKMAGETP